MIEILLNESSIQDHINSQNSSYEEYVANLILLFYEYDSEFTILKLAKILTASLVRGDKELSIFLVSDKRYDLPVILKCCAILDSRRLYNQLNKKTDKLKDAKKISKHKTILANVKALNEDMNISLTQSKIKFIKKNWISNLSKEKLEYMALLYPQKHWKQLIDIFHLKPSDFELSWFSKYIFTNEYPADSIIDICNSINSENIKDIINKYKLPYDFLRLKFKDLLNDDLLEDIFDYTELSNILRHWDNFNKPNNRIKFIYRLEKGEALNMPYGELMKRTQTLIEKKEDTAVTSKLIDIAENKLKKYNIDIEQPVVVLGDASSSMNVAIKTSSIITSILVKICNAKLHLFRTHDEFIESPPTNVSEVLDFMEQFKAHSCTSPAASLYPYYERREIVKTFIIVTDEEENTDYNGKWGATEGYFAEIFKKYRQEVYPSKLVFVSFLQNNKDGFMVTHLKQIIPGIESDIIQFFMNLKNPDLRKLDSILNMLSIKTDFYEDKCCRIINKINSFDKGTNIFTNLDFLLSNDLDNVISITI